MKLRQIDEGCVAFQCPGCGHDHRLTVNGRRNSNGASWNWNGSLDKPTFTPSLNVVGYCHSFITDGNIQFLTDSVHHLAGKTVDIPEYEE